MLGDGSLANLEYVAKDAIQRVLANPDVQSAAESLRSGALKVCDFDTSFSYFYSLLVILLLIGILGGFLGVVWVLVGREMWDEKDYERWMSADWDLL